MENEIIDSYIEEKKRKRRDLDQKKVQKESTSRDMYNNMHVYVHYCM